MTNNLMKNRELYIRVKKMLYQMCLRCRRKGQDELHMLLCRLCVFVWALVFATLIDITKRTGNPGAELKIGVIIVLVSFFHYRDNLLMTP